MDDDKIQRDTVVGRRMIMYNIIFKEVIMLLPEGSKFKAWLEKRVATLRKYAVKSIEKFIDEIEEKEWGPTAEKLKIFAKKEPTIPVSAVAEISERAREAIAAFRTTANLDTDRKIRTQFKEVAEKLEGKKEYAKVKFSNTDEFKEACNQMNKAPEEICKYCMLCHSQDGLSKYAEQTEVKIKENQCHGGFLSRKGHINTQRFLQNCIQNTIQTK